MEQRKKRPWLFSLLAALILLAGGGAVGLAAWGVTAPRSGAILEMDTPQVPTVLGQSAEEVLFYPWPLYNRVERHPATEWGADYPQVADLLLSPVWNLLGFQLTEDPAARWEKAESYGFWKDCPVTSADGQTALLDAAYSTDGVQGISWVVRSQGDLPTPEEQEAALARVQDDLRGLLLGDSSHPDLITLLEGLTNILYQGYSGWNYPYQWPADLLLCVGDLIANQLTLVQNCWYLAPELGDNTPQEQLEEHCANMAQQGNYTVQVVTTQRQVVVVISSGSAVLGIYYDAVLAQYTGFGVNF